MATLTRLRNFVQALAALADTKPSEAHLLGEARQLLLNLVAVDDWLPERFSRASQTRYQQYLLHCDAAERFSVVSFVWGPGQTTPVHDHQVWGLVGVLRGAEREERFARAADGTLTREDEAVMHAGDVSAVGPGLGDIHRVSNALPRGTSVSIHVYGGNIGAVERWVYDAGGAPKRFISGYSQDITPNLWDRSGTAMSPTSISPREVREALLMRQEIAVIDVREEAAFAAGHPLFAAQIPLRRLADEAPWRVPRADALLVVYDDGEELAAPAAAQLCALGFGNVRQLAGGLAAWRAAGYEIFEDVNSYSKAFGELVEHRRHTPSLPAPDVQKLIEENANLLILDARRFDEYRTMSIPTGISVPGAELVLSAPGLAPDPATTIVVNCAGRTRSLIGAQSLINAGLPNKVFALRNGTIGWTLAGQRLDAGQTRRAGPPSVGDAWKARERARETAARAAVKRLSMAELAALRADANRTLYCFDVRQEDAFTAGHIPGFRHAPGGQLVQETDHFAPVRGARIVLADDAGARADMTASWLAQMGWEVFVLDGGFDGALATGGDGAPPPRDAHGKYKRPYEGTENKAEAMQAYLDWEYGLVAQLARDGTHGFFVI